MSTDYVKDKCANLINNPYEFVMSMFDFSPFKQSGPSSQQTEALKAFPKAPNKRMSIRSGHGTGKDAFAAWIAIWFITTRPYSHIICTAPTARQLKDVLWSEISKWLRNSPILKGQFTIQKDKIYPNYTRESKDEWWIRAISTNAKHSRVDQQEVLAGQHAESQLIIGDEASGIPDPVFVPLEGAMTQDDNWCLLIGNPTRSSGYFHDTQFHSVISKQWAKFHWDSRKSSNVTEGFINYFRIKYGEDSNVFRVRVLGEPPIESDNVLIPLAWAQQCIGNDLNTSKDLPKYLGVDVARFGSDPSIILPRQGNTIEAWQTFYSMDTDKLADHVLMTFRDEEADGIGIDAIGLGGSIVDILTNRYRIGRRVQEVNAYDASTNKAQFHRLRDELWYAMREKCRRMQYSFPDVTIKIANADIHIGEELANELSAPMYDLDGGYIKVESKTAMKRRGLKSPNIADALGCTEYFYEISDALWGKKHKNDNILGRLKPYSDDYASDSNTWMTA